MPWARRSARGAVEAHRVLFCDGWREKATLYVDREGALDELRSAPPERDIESRDWVAPPAVKLCEDRSMFARSDGRATPYTVRRGMACLLNDGFADVGIRFDLSERENSLTLLMQEALIFFAQANFFKMGFSYLGHFDLNKLSGLPRRKGAQTKNAFDRKAFEAQVEAFEAVCGVLRAVQDDGRVGWSQWVRLNPLEASARAALVALRVRFAQVPTVVELEVASKGAAAEALYELLRVGVLDAQVTLYMPQHTLTAHQAAALASQGTRWTLTPEAFATRSTPVTADTQTTPAFVFELQKHVLIAPPPQPATGWPVGLLNMDATTRALGLSRRRLSPGEPLAAIVFRGVLAAMPAGSRKPFSSQTPLHALRVASCHLGGLTLTRER